MIRVGIVGCGAVSEILHVPALLARDDVYVSAAIDPNLERAKNISKKTGAKVFSAISEALDFIDAGIICMPHSLHHNACVELLNSGKHVLIEKPMALSTVECDEMIEASRLGGVTITVGQMRRFSPVVRAAKSLLELKILGNIVKFSIHEGGVFNWPVASDYLLKKETAGGGVLIDTGAHTLDMLLWIFGSVAELDYRDDAFGGVEADCEIRMKMSSGAEGYVELSRTRNLPTELIVEGERGRMVAAYIPNQLTLEIDGYPIDTFTTSTNDADGCTLSIWNFMIARQLENWIASLIRKQPSLVTGVEGRKVVEFIERCYRSRGKLKYPWI